MTQPAVLTDKDGNITHQEGERGFYYLTQEEKDRRRAQRVAWVAAQHPAWQAQGQYYRGMRVAAGLTLAEMSQLTGFSACKMGSFELGKPVGTREVLQKVYGLVLHISRNRRVLREACKRAMGA